MWRPDGTMGWDNGGQRVGESCEPKGGERKDLKGIFFWERTREAADGGAGFGREAYRLLGRRKRSLVWSRYDCNLFYIFSLQTFFFILFLADFRFNLVLEGVYMVLCIFMKFKTNFFHAFLLILFWFHLCTTWTILCFMNASNMDPRSLTSLPFSLFITQSHSTL